MSSKTRAPQIWTKKKSCFQIIIEASEFIGISAINISYSISTRVVQRHIRPHCYCQPHTSSANKVHIRFKQHSGGTRALLIAAGCCLKRAEGRHWCSSWVPKEPAHMMQSRKVKGLPHYWPCLHHGNSCDTDRNSKPNEISSRTSSYFFLLCSFTLWREREKQSCIKQDKKWQFLI